MRVLIDPGHYAGYNQGIIQSYYEGTVMFDLALYLKRELERYKNIECDLTKNTAKEDLSLEARGNKASNYDVFISLHSNAASSPSANYVVAFYSVKRPGSKSLCDKLGKSVASLMSARYSGSLTKLYPDTTNTDYYGVIRSAAKHERCKYIYIIEHGFHTNWNNCSFLKSSENLKKIAQAEAKVIAENFYLPLKEEVMDVSMTKQEFNSAVREVIQTDNPTYEDYKDIPDGWKATVQELLDSGAVNGGTDKEVNATDVNLSRDTLKGIIITLNYLKSKGII